MGSLSGDVLKAAVTLKNDLKESGNFLPLDAKRLETLASIPPNALDENGRPFLPYKLHTFFDSPHHFYSDMEITIKKPLGNLRKSPIFDDRIGIEVMYTTNEIRSDFYFKVKTREIMPKNSDSPRSFRMIANDRLSKGKIAYFRFRSPVLDKDCEGFDLTFVSAEGYWKIEKCDKGNGKFVFASNEKVLDNVFDNNSWRLALGETISESWRNKEDTMIDADYL